MPLVLNGTTGVSGVNGSAGTPALRGTDADSGVYFTGSQVGFSTNGAGTTMTMDASGNVTFPGTVVMSSPYAMRNKIINGAMEIYQRATGTVTLNSTAQYTLDRWSALEDTDGTMTVRQTTNAPAGFKNAMFFETGTPDASLGATQYVSTNQLIEGFNIVDLAWGTASAKTVTLSFWVRSSLTGTFGGSIRNGSLNRSYPFTYTISAANTYEYKTVTIPGDTTGTWATDNTLGLVVTFGLGVGSTYSGTAGAWAATNYLSATGAVSVIGDIAGNFYLTGVQLEIGTTATPFERRLYSQELSLCQRYAQILGGNFAGNVENSSTLSIIEKFVTEMRAAPTCSVRSGATASFRYGAGDVVISSPGLSATTASTTGVWTLVTGGSGYGTVPYPIMARDPTRNFILASAEL